MIDHDNIPAEIDRLHSEAEDLADAARFAQHDETAAALREDAKRKIRQAARLRAQVEG